MILPRAFAALIVAGAGCLCTPLAAQQKVPLVLNHLVIVLDSGTYRDIKGSPFLREQFAASDTVPLAGQFADVRLFGKYNYLAFAEPTVYRRAKAGQIAIVLSTEAPGGLDRLAHDWQLPRQTQLPIDGLPPRDRRDYLFDAIDVIALAAADSTVERTRFAVVQYGSELVKQLATTDSLPVTNLTNARFLARYYDPRKLFEYLSAATLAIPAADIAKIARVLERDSVTVLHEGEGVIVKLDGFTLHLIPPWTGAGVKQLQFALTREAVANPVYRFGPHSQLRFGPGPIAVWDFNQ